MRCPSAGVTWIACYNYGADFDRKRGSNFEQKEELIKVLFEQMPKTEPLAGPIVYVGDLEAGTQQIREMVSQSLQRSAEQLREQELGQ
ncbi:MAG: hypothetical protein L0226_12610 [Acidobacteria bacterium]|nr:hypothetical protein [Acidobacteriota bacterium]